MSRFSDVSAFEEVLAAALGAPVRLVLTHVDALREEPDAAECERLAGFGHPKRIADWRNGRAALARLLRESARDEEPETLCFPHREFSLSHSDGWAVAAGITNAGGVGVDLEFARRMDPRAARFFLTDAEEALVAALDEAAREATMLRLWTAKEALFKACPDNSDLLLADIVITDPIAATGTARRRDGSDPVLRYCSLDLGNAWLSLAYNPATEPPR